MNADALNKWLTLSANIGVVIGLILLLIELDQNRDIVSAQLHQSRADAHVWQRMERADSEYLAPVIHKFDAAGGFDNPSAIDQLTPLELSRFIMYLSAAHSDYDNLFFQYQQGYLDEEVYLNIAMSIKILAPWWKKLNVYETRRRSSFDEEIKRIMSSE